MSFQLTNIKQGMQLSLLIRTQFLFATPRHVLALVEVTVETVKCGSSDLTDVMMVANSNVGISSFVSVFIS